MALRWYVVHAYSNFEHKVSQALKDRVKLHSLDAKFGDVLVPTEEVVEMRDGQKRKSERKFFPGYVLVQMEMDDETWHLVKETPKVLGFIGGTPEKPAPITEKEAMTILRRVEEGAEKPRPKVLFEPGEVDRGSCMWRKCQRPGYLPPMRARSGPVRLEPHWKGWSKIESWRRDGSP